MKIVTQNTKCITKLQKNIYSAKQLYCGIYDKAVLMENTGGCIGKNETAVFDALAKYITELEPTDNDIVFSFRGE